ncbi:lipocalin family protein [Tabrizicola sp.]|uniref:lipocalin family protein n=1 Tax=Tabrizicola sp. TaxID=2005166 RepID=UPI003F2F273B
MPRIALLALLTLAACAAVPSKTAVFRESGAEIWSAAAFQPMEIAGKWRQAAAFQSSDGSCSSGQVEFQPANGGLQVAGTLCLDGVAQNVSGLATAAGPGRLRVNGQEDWWILWVDSGYRTLAIGTPSGGFGFVLDRGAIPADRLAAVREIFDFNGYATGALRAF